MVTAMILIQNCENINEHLNQNKSLVPRQQASLESTSKDIRHDIVPKLWTIVNNRRFRIP